MAVANPNSFDFFKAGEPSQFLTSKVDNTTFDYYKSNEPGIYLEPVPVTAVTAILTQIFIIE